MTLVGSGAYTYEVDQQWGRGSDGLPEFGLVSGVAGDSYDRVYLFIRRPVAEILVLDPRGTLLSRWGEGQFVEPHMLFITPRDEILATDISAHTVTRWTLDGRLVQTWGTPGTPGAPGLPFNSPTRAALAPDGEMYVSDGYGQFRVHRFGADGTLKHSWGEQGAGAGQFALPHDVWIDPRDRVLVCEVLARWGSKGDAPDQFSNAPHSIWADSRGDVYVSEVVDPNKFQKYVRQS